MITREQAEAIPHSIKPVQRMTHKRFKDVQAIRRDIAGYNKDDQPNDLNRTYKKREVKWVSRWEGK